MHPITEQCNVLTANIDVATPEDIVKLLEKCDQEIFEGWQGEKTLFQSEFLNVLEKISKIAADLVKSPSSSLIVLSGCGTSGRLAFTTARYFNELLRKSGFEKCFYYTIAGGDKALLTSQEAPEDDPEHGAETLKKACQNKSKVLYIGITCGLSAPYVAGQLSYCMNHLDVYTPVLLGFNPVELARNLKIEKWDKTFLQVANQMNEISKKDQGLVLTPVVGPEPITGSSRMKGGSTTKIILDTIFVKMQQQLQNLPLGNPTCILEVFQKVNKDVYKQCQQQLPTLIKLAGESLNQAGHVYYLGDCGEGIFGVIDASECPPTFGASLDDIRGFVTGGLAQMGNNDGDISSLGAHFQISLQDFGEQIFPKLSSNDLVIFICKEGYTSEELEDICQKVLTSKKAKSAVMHFMSEYNNQVPSVFASQCNAYLPLSLPLGDILDVVGKDSLGFVEPLLVQIAVKWVCNAISTGAHILKGKVYQNIMVDLKVSNNKLFHRAVGIIQKFSKCSTDESHKALLRAIYETDTLSVDQLQASVSEHILVATPKDRVVPTALLGLLLKCSVQDAKQYLAENPVIRASIQKGLCSSVV